MDRGGESQRGERVVTLDFADLDSVTREARDQPTEQSGVLRNTVLGVRRAIGAVW